MYLSTGRNVKTNDPDSLYNTTTSVAWRCDTTTYLPEEPGFRWIFERGSLWTPNRIANHSTGLFNETHLLVMYTPKSSSLAVYMTDMHRLGL
jgi:hypothetical protein